MVPKFITSPHPPSCAIIGSVERIAVGGKKTRRQAYYKGIHGINIAQDVEFAKFIMLIRSTIVLAGRLKPILTTSKKDCPG